MSSPLLPKGFGHKIENLIARLRALDPHIRYTPGVASKSHIPVSISLKTGKQWHQYDYSFSAKDKHTIVTAGIQQEPVASIRYLNADAVEKFLARIVQWHLLTLVEQSIERRRTKRFHARVDRQESALVLEESGRAFKYPLAVSYYGLYPGTKRHYGVSQNHRRAAMPCRALARPRLLQHSLPDAAKQSDWLNFSSSSLNALILHLQGHGIPAAYSDEEQTVTVTLAPESCLEIKINKKTREFELDSNYLDSDIGFCTPQFAYLTKTINSLSNLKPQALLQQPKPELATPSSVPTVSSDLELV